MGLQMPPAGTALGSTTWPHRRQHAGLDEVRYVHPDGSDSRDGLTWGTAKQTIQGAVDSLALVGGEGRGIVKIGGAHTATSTINLTGRSNITFRGEADVAGIVSFMPSPAATINAQSITTGAVFYCDNTTDRTSGNFTFENLSISAGRTGMRFIEMANIRLRGVGIEVAVNDGHADNCAILMENAFWAWYRDCAFHAPTGSTGKPAVILRGLTTNVDAAQSGLQRFQNVTFGGGGAEVQQLKVPNTGGNWYFENCLVENASTALLKITEGAGLLTNWHDYGIVFINSEMSDAPGAADIPILYVDSPHAIIDSPVFIHSYGALNLAGNIPAAFILKNGSVNSARMMGSNREARYGIDENNVIAGNWLSDKEWGFDLIADDDGTNSDILNHGGGPAIRLSPGGQVHSQVGISAKSANGIVFGPGTATYDTNLYRSAANTLKTDDTFLANVAGLGTKHEGAATPTGGTSGEIRIGNGKIWVNDAGTWKSVAVA